MSRLGLSWPSQGSALVAVAAAAYLTLGGRATTDAGAPLTSIAVLPFDDMSARIEALRVLERTSAFAQKGKDIATVGKELRVGSVVEGSVRRSDDQLRVTAQLIRVSDGSHLWSARYDRKLSDVFAIQSEIARAIAEAIRDEIGIDYDAPQLGDIHEPSDVRAYERLRKAIDAYLPFRTEEGLRKGIEHLEEALAIDPEYATARAHLGYCYHWLWVAHGRAESDLARARSEVERALARDETNGTANAVLADILMWQVRWDDARRVVERGLAYNPGHSHLRALQAYLLMFQGRHDDGRDDEAVEASLRALPPELEGLESAVRRGVASSGFSGGVRAAYEWRVARSGHPCTDDAGRAASELALLGEVDAMFECLEEASRRRSDVVPLLTPAFDSYRKDPRFVALLRRVNLAE